MTRVVEVRTPSRLHFGLSRLGSAERRFGGLGAMLQEEGILLRMVSSDHFQVQGPQRIQQFAHAFAEYQQLATLPACKIEVVFHPPEHTGLGLGTQLGLATVVGLCEWLGLPWRDAERLSQMSGRGQRSAVGTHGFLHGGLIVDAGRAKGERLGRLAQQCPLPEDWRFVLVRGSAATGLSGQAEAAAIDALPPIPEDGFQRLQKLVETQLLPAARAADWASFGEALYAYGLQAGNYFAPAQGGPFASTAISERVELIRSLGIPGVGQSSWGPTLYAVTADQQQAQRLVTQLQAQPSCADCQFRIARPNNTGVQVRCT